MRPNSGVGMVSTIEDDKSRQPKKIPSWLTRPGALPGPSENVCFTCVPRIIGAEAGDEQTLTPDGIRTIEHMRDRIHGNTDPPVTRAKSTQKADAMDDSDCSLYMHPREHLGLSRELSSVRTPEFVVPG